MNRFSLISAASGLLLAAPCAAQIAPGQSGTSSMSYLSSSEAWETLTEFGKCYANYSRTDAVKLVSTQAGSADEANTYRRLFSKAYQSCLGTVEELQFSYGMVRGAIAEGLCRKQIPVPSALIINHAPDQPQVHTLSEAAICYTARHIEAAKNLVGLTKPGSKKEAAAIDALWLDFGQCVPTTASAALKLDITLVRFRIAEALWRLGATPGLGKEQAQ